jgi:hypothetical protein
MIERLVSTVANLWKIGAFPAEACMAHAEEILKDAVSKANLLTMIQQTGENKDAQEIARSIGVGMEDFQFLSMIAAKGRLSELTASHPADRS